MQAPDETKWVATTDPETVRTQIIALKGNTLYNHLVGTGANAALAVQWGFKNSPDIPTNPHVAPDKHGWTPGGVINDTDLLDGPSFVDAVNHWMCLEAKISGSPDLGLPTSGPGAVDCNAVLATP
jgi:hypothetical protein